MTECFFCTLGASADLPVTPRSTVTLNGLKLYLKYGLQSQRDAELCEMTRASLVRVGEARASDGHPTQPFKPRLNNNTN